MSRLAERLNAYNAGLLPDMLALKYEAMTDNVFRFYRGTCHLFYEDLAKNNPLPDSPASWLCGDLHLENFGSYQADNDRIYFDLNDFDEAIKAPVLWELARMLTSILLAFEVLEIEEEKAINMVNLFIKTYRETLVNAKAYAIDPRTATGIVCDFLRSAEHSKDSALVEKHTEKKKKKLVLSLEDERHFKIRKPLRQALMAHIQRWIDNGSDSPYHYKVKGAVFRLAGTGSVGLKRYLFFLKNTKVKNNYLFIDMKQSRASSLSPFVKIQQPVWGNEAERIIGVQQRMQYMSASMLSATVFENEPYVLQELQPVKDSIKFKLIRDNYRDIYQVIYDMAQLTASSQLRSGGMDESATIDQLRSFAADAAWDDPLVKYVQASRKRFSNYYRQFKKDYLSGGLLIE